MANYKTNTNIDPVTGLKTCTKCQVAQPLDAFYKDAKKSSGLGSHCKTCVNATRECYRGTPAHDAVERRYRGSAKGRATQRKNNLLNRTKETFKAAKRVGLARYRARQRGLPATHRPRDERFLRAYWNNACAICGEHAGLWKVIALDHWIPISSPQCPGTVPGNMLPLCHARKGIQGAIPDCNVSKSVKEPLGWLREKLGKRQAVRKLREIEQFFAAAIAYARGDEALGVA